MSAGDKLEPDARPLARSLDAMPEGCVPPILTFAPMIMSAAISLKRIADALEGVVCHNFDSPAIRVRRDQ